MVRSSAPRLITLTSDLGSAYAAQMKAVLAHRRLPGTIVDLAHDLKPHAIGEAAFLLRAMAVGFPAGTVHVAVIDPGVGGRRAPIAVECADGSTLVGPDNGVLLPLAEALGRPRAFRIDPQRLERRGRVGTTFDGRDLFAPTAAELARGTPARRLGVEIQPHHYAVPAAVRSGRRAIGEVVHADRFGNLVTNVPTDWVPRDARRLEVRIGHARRRALPIASSYEALGRHGAGVLGSSFGLLEVAVREGSAARRFRADVASPVEFGWASPRRAHVRR